MLAPMSPRSWRARALAVEADVADEAAVIQATAEIDNAGGRIEALVNNAAWIPPRQHILDVQASLLERVLLSNVVGSFLMTKHVAPVMIRGGGGRRRWQVRRRWR
ncbi:MAG: hypothetical protein QOJ06_2149 [Pseudonocardiales bacterium]|nr:hypothetical protein [Pseudonocardiales bacterium]